MIMPPGIRKFALTVHVTSSVGWIGAVVVFITLVAAAMSSQDMQTLRVAWIAMGWTGGTVIVPMAIASLLTGLIMAAGTRWGLFRHYWVLLSLALTILAIFVLLENMQTVRYFADIATEMDRINVEVLRDPLPSELVHSSLGLVVLIVIQVLNMYKPRGLTWYGWRKQRKERTLGST